jgi:Tfp pilus tip-associated adhesin PilY1
VFLGANDGAMHAVDAAFWDTSTNRYDTGTGKELFAWLPRETMPTLDDIAFGLDQRWTVDGPPTVADVYIDPISTDSGGTFPLASDREWRTLLLFGERQGGRSITVLDVTTPDPYDDGLPLSGANRMPGCLDGAASGCSGEWPSLRFELKDTSDEDGNLQPDMGYTWSKPLVGFLKVEDGPDDGTDPDDVSVAIFGGGYDRATLTGNWIYIVNLETGAILFKQNVIGKAAGQVAATDLNLDGYFERVYWGTTDGKIWRMDVETPGIDSDNDGRVDSWSPYVLFNAGSSADPGQGPGTTNQPFFLEPKLVPITFDASGYPVLAIAIGTGNRDNLFFETSEYNRFYLVVDRNDGVTVTEANLQAVAADAAVTTSNYLNDPNLRGWYLVLSDGYEKTNTTALVVDQYVIFSTFAPSEVEVYPPDSGLCRVRGNAKTYVVYLWNANPVGDSRYVEHTGVEGRPPVLATDPVLYTGADGRVHILQSLDDLQLTEPVESWAIPLRVFSWKED